MNDLITTSACLSSFMLSPEDKKLIIEGISTLLWLDKNEKDSNTIKEMCDHLLDSISVIIKKAKENYKQSYNLLVTDDTMKEENLILNLNSNQSSYYQIVKRNENLYSLFRRYCVEMIQQYDWLKYHTQLMTAVVSSHCRVCHLIVVDSLGGDAKEQSQFLFVYCSSVFKQELDGLCLPSRIEVDHQQR